MAGVKLEFCGGKDLIVIERDTGIKVVKMVCLPNQTKLGKLIGFISVPEFTGFPIISNPPRRLIGGKPDWRNHIIEQYAKPLYDLGLYVLPDSEGVSLVTSRRITESRSTPYINARLFFANAYYILSNPIIKITDLLT